MNSRERVRIALNHQEPDRVPVDLGGYQSGIMAVTYNKLKEALSINEKTEILEVIQQLAKPSEKMLKFFNIDTRYIFPKSPVSWNPKKMSDGSYVGTLEWGNQKIIKKPDCYYYEFYDHPLADADVDSLDKFQYWPDIEAPERIEGLKNEILNLYKNTDYAICTTLGSAVYEQASYLTGMERFFIDLIQNKKFINKLLDKALKIEMELYGKFLDVTGEYLDVVQLFSDFGGQNAPLFSPNLYREIIKPRDKELIQMIKSKTQAKVFFHTCGSSYEFIPDLIEIGVDILNPIQVSAAKMNPSKLKREFGNDLCFWGGIDTQRILPYGTPEQVDKEVKKRIEELAPGGGYVLNSVHNIQADVPPENVLAMFKAAEKYGQYT